MSRLCMIAKNLETKIKKLFSSEHSFKWHCKRTLRIMLQAVMDFTHSEGQLRASALTYYTLFAIVPVLALLFGVAKGFELEVWLKNSMLARSPQHNDMYVWLFSFAERTLEQTRGGVVAGVGALMLCWSVIKMIGNIEKAVNAIWHVKKARTLFRKFTDYLSFLIIVPILLLATSSATFMVSGMLEKFANSNQLLTFSRPIIEFGIRCMPYLVAWILFTFICIFLPNTRVRFRAALFGGVISGTIYQLLQAGYFFIQIALARYNVIYGSFSALPLFLIWTYLNWIVVLFGITLSSLYQNYDYESDLAGDAGRSPGEKRLIALLFAAMITKDFADGKPPVSSDTLVKRTNMSPTLIKELLGTLEQNKIIAALADNEYENVRYIPAMPLEKMTLFNVLEHYDRHDSNSSFSIINEPYAQHALKIMSEIRKNLADSTGNRSITDLLGE